MITNSGHTSVRPQRALPAPSVLRSPSKRKQRAPKVLSMLGSLLVAVTGLGWVGVHVEPASFPSVTRSLSPPQMIPLPADLPAPVALLSRDLW